MLLLLGSIVCHSNDCKAQSRKNAQQHDDTAPAADECDDGEYQCSSGEPGVFLAFGSDDGGGGRRLGSDDGGDVASRLWVLLWMLLVLVGRLRGVRLWRVGFRQRIGLRRRIDLR